VTEPAAAPPAPPHPPAGGFAGVGRRLFKVRGWVYLPFAALAFALPAPGGMPEAALLGGGAALVAFGVAFRFAAIRRMGGAARTHKHKAKRVVRTGPYAWVRNPLYIANTAAFLGFVLLCGQPWLALGTWLLLWLYYHAIARYEEGVLAESFGPEFVAYAAEVPLWIPRPPRTPPPPEDPADLYPWGKLLTRERGFLLNVAAMVALAAVKRWGLPA
jgi:protein-S-isoprenylcysteine O-methyltransferase Ste14